MPDINGNPLPDRGGKPPAAGWEDRFLEALEKSHLVGEACKAAGISRSFVCKQRRNRPDFDERWTEVEEKSTELLEQVAVRRAAEGSDQLMIFLLKARRPEVYRENIRHEHTGAIEGTLTVQLDGQQPIQMDSANRREAARLLLAGRQQELASGEVVEGAARDAA